MGPKTLPWVKYIPFLIIPLLALAWGISTRQSPVNIPVTRIQITTYESPKGRDVLPEQRRAFALKLQKNSPSAYKDAVVTTTGNFHTTLSIRSPWINGTMISSMSSGREPFPDVREMGFKHVMMSNDKEAWDIDLKN